MTDHQPDATLSPEPRTPVRLAAADALPPEARSIAGKYATFWRAHDGQMATVVREGQAYRVPLASIQAVTPEEARRAIGVPPVTPALLLQCATEFRVGSVLVANRGHGTWAIVDNIGNVLTRAGEWEWEPMPSSRTDEFIAQTRFPLEEAVSRALEVSTPEALELLQERLAALEAPASPRDTAR